MLSGSHGAYVNGTGKYVYTTVENGLVTPHEVTFTGNGGVTVESFIAEIAKNNGTALKITDDFGTYTVVAK